MEFLKEMFYRENLREECLKLFDKKFQDIKEIKDFGTIKNTEVYTSMTAKANYKEKVRNLILYSSDTKALELILEDLKESENIEEKILKKVA